MCIRDSPVLLYVRFIIGIRNLQLDPVAAEQHRGVFHRYVVGVIDDVDVYKRQIYATTAGGFAIDWFYDQLCREMTKKEFYKYVDDVIDQCMDDTSVTFDPYMTGDRQSLEKKTGAWHGLTLEATRDKMLASMLRSMQGVLKKAIDQAAEVQKLSPVIKISGGMATPPYILSLIHILGVVCRGARPNRRLSALLWVQRKRKHPLASEPASRRPRPRFSPSHAATITRTRCV